MYRFNARFVYYTLVEYIFSAPFHKHRDLCPRICVSRKVRVFDRKLRKPPASRTHAHIPTRRLGHDITQKGSTLPPGVMRAF